MVNLKLTLDLNLAFAFLIQKNQSKIKSFWAYLAKVNLS